jgi:hypothetical protein
VHDDAPTAAEQTVYIEQSVLLAGNAMGQPLRP